MSTEPENVCDSSGRVTEAEARCFNYYILPRDIYVRKNKNVMALTSASRRIRWYYIVIISVVQSYNYQVIFRTEVSRS